MHPQLEVPIKLTLCITNTCTQNCAHCYGDCGRDVSIEELTTEEWKRFIDHLVDIGVMHVFVEGGEPLKRPDIMDILAYMSRRLDITLRTFADLVTPEIARELKRLAISMACVDFLGGTAPTHDALTERDGSFERGLNGARALVEAGIPVYPLMILNSYNASEVQEFLELAASLKAYKAAVLRLYPLGRAKRRWQELALPLPEMIRVINDVKVPCGLDFVNSWHPNDGNTCYQMSAVSPFGQSIGCPYLREYVALGDVRKVAFSDTWDAPLWRKLRSGAVRDTCSECHSTQGSNGGCRATAFAYHGDWEAPDPFCSVMNRGIDLLELPPELFWRKPWVEQ